MENKTALGLRAFAEGIFLGVYLAEALKVVCHETDGENLPTHVLIEMTADSMADVCLNDDSSMSKKEKRMLVRGAFRKLTCDIIHKHPDLLERPVDACNVPKESKSDNSEYSSKGEPMPRVLIRKPCSFCHRQQQHTFDTDKYRKHFQTKMEDSNV